MQIKDVIKRVTGKEPIYLEDLTDLWLEWFTGDVKSFHHYKVYNGQEDIKCKRRTLNMAKQVCEDWADLLLNEKTEIAIGDEENQNKMNKLLQQLKFWQKGNKGVEESFALGQGAFVESVDDNKNVKLQFVNRTKIIPITVEDDEIKECAFVNINGTSVVIQIHLLDRGEYIIHTLIGEKSDNDLTFYFDDPDRNKIFFTKSNIPWFQFLKPNISNNIDINSPMGISVYANSLDKLEGVDLAYDAFCTEMQLGKSRIFVDKQLTRYDETGEHQVFDNSDVAFYVYGNGEDGNNQPLQFYNPTLRVNELFDGVNKSLNLLSTAVGFGDNKYRFDSKGLSTATQVISENSELFRTLKKHEIILNDVIIDVIKALMYISNNFGNGDFKFKEDVNIEVHFDDSIIEDKESEKESDRQDVSMQVMSKAEYRAKWYSEDEDTAQQNIEKIQAEQPSLSNFFSSEE